MPHTNSPTLPPQNPEYDRVAELHADDPSAFKICYWIGNDEHMLESHLTATYPDGTTQKIMRFVD